MGAPLLKGEACTNLAFEKVRLKSMSSLEQFLLKSVQVSWRCELQIKISVANG